MIRMGRALGQEIDRFSVPQPPEEEGRGMGTSRVCQQQPLRQTCLPHCAFMLLPWRGTTHTAACQLTACCADVAVVQNGCAGRQPAGLRESSPAQRPPAACRSG
eukprot:1142120-Pelagomonas_calceolata.AAC.2